MAVLRGTSAYYCSEVWHTLTDNTMSMRMHTAANTEYTGYADGTPCPEMLGTTSKKEYTACML
jgi:hypothetical protein